MKKGLQDKVKAMFYGEYIILEKPDIGLISITFHCDIQTFLFAHVHILQLNIFIINVV